MSADRNLLFGVLALQLDFITRDQLIAGLQAWVNDKGKPLALLLENAGALDATNRRLLEPLVERHIQQHGNDPQQSLATLSSAERLRRELDEIEDGDVQRSLVSLGQARTKEAADPEATLDPTLSLGVQTSAGTRFRILRPHARGGLGEVFVARDNELGREVALKEIQHGKADDPDARARFTREAEITGGLEHPGIVPVYGLGAYPDGRPFYAMRFIRGKSLQDAIKAYHARENSSPTEQNLELRRLLQRFIDVCEAIDYAHSRGVLHRDLKPGNIMLGRYGETLVVDWGLAKAVGQAASESDPSPASPEASQLPEPALVPSSHGSSEATQLGSALGTIAYMSPEQANGRWDLLGPASDVFCLGATLYHLLTGQPPYTGKRDEAFARAVLGEYPRPRARARQIPAPLEAICLKSLALEPKDRYSTAQAFARDIERCLADEPITALPESLLSRTNRWTRRHRHWMQAGSVALLLVAITAVVAYFYQRETARQNEILARDNGKLAEEKGQLANTNLQLAHEAQAKAESLRAVIAKSHFAKGLAEYDAARLDNGVLELQRAWSLTRSTDKFHQLHKTALEDRIMRGGSSNIVLRHRGSIFAVAISPDGNRVVTGSVDKTAQLWDIHNGAALGEPMRHDQAVLVAAFSPHGDCLITGSMDNTARLWNTSNGSPIGAPLQHDGWVQSIAFAPMGNRVITGSWDKSARIWDAKTGEPITSPIRHKGKVFAVAFSPRGDRVLTGSDDNTAQVWDSQSGKPIGEPITHHSKVGAVAFSPKGDRFLTGSSDGIVRLWDAATGAPVGEPMLHGAEVWSMVFSPRGDKFVTASKDKTARLWDAQNGASIRGAMRHDDLVFSASFSPLGDRIVTACGDATARLWNADGSLSLATPMRHDQSVVAAVFSLQGDRIITGSFDRTVRIWDLRFGTPLCESGQKCGINAVAFDPQGNHVVVGRADNTAQLWDARTAEPYGVVMPHDGAIADAAFSPQGHQVLTGSWDKTARLWDAVTGKSLREPIRHDDGVRVVRFSPTGDRAITTTSYTSRIWETGAGQSTGESIRHPEPVLNASLGTDGDRVLTGSQVARLWDARTGASLGQPLSHEFEIVATDFSAQVNRVVTASGHFARLWDAQTGAPIGEPMRHEGIICVALSPAGTRIVTGGRDNAARLWDALTTESLGEPMRHNGEVGAVMFSSNGERVLTGSADKTARLWDSRTGIPIGEPLPHEDAVDILADNHRGDRIITGRWGKNALLWDVGTLIPKNLAEYATTVTGFEVDGDGNTNELKAEELETRRKEFYAKETEWAAAMESRAEERQRRFLGQQLKKAREESDFFAVYQSARWLSAEELAKIEPKSLKAPPMRVLVGWFRDGKLDQVGAALRESADVPEAGAGKVLATLAEAIPVLYWETDERLGALRKELEKRVVQESPSPR